MQRQIVLDTETTGLDPKSGHRIIEIGCIEMINRRITSNHFQVYINPERDIDYGAEQVHGLSKEFLQDKPVFADIADDFINYIDGAELIIHNASFDIGFLNHEFSLLKRGIAKLDASCSVIDTLQMARKMHPGQRNNLDALCKRYGIDNSGRNLHGALVDADLLALLYIAMTSGQECLFAESNQNSTVPKMATDELPSEKKNSQHLKIQAATATEEAEHQNYLQEMHAGDVDVLWK